MMTFHEPTDWAMIVMDGRRVVAKARYKIVTKSWLLKMDCGCWVDIRARTPLRPDFPKGFGDMWSKYPDMMMIPTKREARKILKSVMEFNGQKF